jgi:flagellin-like hook-associated protein FlgL
MVIQHNLAGEAVKRYLSINDRKLNKSLEKLSSGYKINRAADDAAGLAVSEKMRRLIGGLKQSKDNIHDGLEMFKTADGAMSTIQGLLRRQKTLAVQSANGNYDDEVDRAAIALEFEQIKKELEDIVDGSNYNNQKLFYGDNDVGVPDLNLIDGDTLLKNGNLLIVDRPTGSNNTFSFYLDDEHYEIDLPLGSYTPNELVSMLNGKFAEVDADVTAEFTESGSGLRFETNGKIFDGFGGSMMYIDSASSPLPPDSILFDNLSYPQTTVLAAHTGARTLSDSYINSLTFDDSNNSLSFTFTDEDENANTYKISVTNGKYNTVAEFTDEIKSQISAAGIADDVDVLTVSGKLRLTAKRINTNVEISKSGMYDDVFRNKLYTNYKQVITGSDGSGPSLGSPGSGTISRNYSPITVGADNRNFSFYYSGNYNVTIPDGTYNTAADFAAALQSAFRGVGISDITVSESSGRLRFENIDQSKTFQIRTGPLAADILPLSVGGYLSYVDGTIQKNEGDPNIYGLSSGYVQGYYPVNDYTRITAGANDTLTMNLNGQDISLQLSEGLYTRNALVNELNNKLGGKATASLYSNYLRITNPEPGNNLIGVNLSNIAGNAANSLFRTNQSSFSVSGRPPSSGSSPSAGYVYRYNYGSHDKETTVSPPNNKVTFSFYDGENLAIEIPEGTYNESQLYSEITAQVSANARLSARVTTRSNYGFVSLQTGFTNSFNITGAPSDWLYRMIYNTQDGTSDIPSNGSVYANGRVDLTEDIILTDKNNELIFDIVKDNVITSHSVKIPPARYSDKDEFTDALNEAFTAAGLPQMKADIIDAKRPDGTAFKSLHIELTPDSSGEFKLEGFRGTAAHELFYRHPLRPDKIWLQVGAYSKDMYRTDIPILMTFEMLHQNANVSTQASANAAIDRIDNAINYVSLKRAITGADFNALSHMNEVRKIQEENIIDAESLIRDADMAEEYMDFQLRQIHTQAARSMLTKSIAETRRALDFLA